MGGRASFTPDPQVLRPPSRPFPDPIQLWRSTRPVHFVRLRRYVTRSIVLSPIADVEPRPPRLRVAEQRVRAYRGTVGTRRRRQCRGMEPRGVEAHVRFLQ